MKNLIFLLLVASIPFQSCQELRKDGKTDKDLLVAKLENIEKEVDRKILELQDQSNLIDGQILRDVEKSIKELNGEKRKIKKSIKNTLAASEKEIDDLKRETEKIENKLRQIQANIMDRLRKLKKMKEKT